MIRPHGRPADVVAFEESVVGFFLETATILGVPKSLAAIYGICFASPEPLSFSDVQERLDISAGSISHRSNGTRTPDGSHVTWATACIHQTFSFLTKIHAGLNACIAT